MTLFVAQDLKASFHFPICTSKQKKMSYSLSKERKRLIVEYDGEYYISVKFDANKLKKRGNGIYIITAEELSYFFFVVKEKSN